MVLSGNWADSSEVPLNSGALHDSSMTKPLAEPPSDKAASGADEPTVARACSIRTANANANFLAMRYETDATHAHHRTKRVGPH